MEVYANSGRGFRMNCLLAEIRHLRRFRVFQQNRPRKRHPALWKADFVSAYLAQAVRVVVVEDDVMRHGKVTRL
jgi:hypothetical protein